MVESLADQLIKIIHQVSPYQDFNVDNYKLDLRGWGFRSPVFEILMIDNRPKVIIEVGTWNGSSAIAMAKYAQEHGVQTTIICVDTWLGSPEHRIDEDYKDSLQLKHGFPEIYYQFLANVILSGMQHCIVPLPQVSISACRWLEQMGFSDNSGKADLIYIDADHTFDTVYSDITEFWKLLAPGGIMFGDDYNDYWPGVKKAVNLFTKNKKNEIHIFGNKWIIQK
jgi:cephalosporin hydroxylase